jgi:hypothetical protein
MVLTVEWALTITAAQTLVLLGAVGVLIYRLRGGAPMDDNEDTRPLEFPGQEPPK